jgi:hypothetical protein
MESKCEALTLENARLANENMILQNEHLIRENVLLRMRSMQSHQMRPEQWFAQQQMNAWSMLPQVPQVQQMPQKIQQVPQKGLGKKTDADSPVKKSDADRDAFASFETESTSAESHSFGSNSEGEDAEPNKALGTPPGLLTTVMMRNIPNNMTREMLLDLINAEGFADSYDFVYLPMDFKNKVGLGYSFINLADSAVAEDFHAHFSGFTRWGLQSDKVCEMTWSDTLQGKDAHIERYRNSPVMHHSMPDECKPLLFKEGERLAFPEPTKRIRAPRQRHV